MRDGRGEAADRTDASIPYATRPRNLGHQICQRADIEGHGLSLRRVQSACDVHVGGTGGKNEGGLKTGSCLVGGGRKVVPWNPKVFKKEV